MLARFLTLAADAIALALWSRTPRLVRIIGETQSTSAQLGVRTAMLLCVLLVWIETEFDLDFLVTAAVLSVVVFPMAAGAMRPAPAPASEPSDSP